MSPSPFSFVPLIEWVFNNCAGHFEVDGVPCDVPDDAEIAEIRQRLLGRRIVEVQEFLDGYVLRLDDQQVVDIEGVWHNDSTAGTAIRFWNKARSDAE